jgi:F-type H+-transporting ATPase subunit beta
MQAGSATKTAAKRSSANGEKPTQNTGRIEEIRGVVIDAVFHDRLPEINHAIVIRRSAANEQE